MNDKIQCTTAMRTLNAITYCSAGQR